MVKINHSKREIGSLQDSYCGDAGGGSIQRLNPMVLSSHYVRDADKFFGKLNSVLQWNIARGESREIVPKCFELGFNFDR